MHVISCSDSVFSFLTYDDSEISFVGRLIFGETDIPIETECRVFDFQLSDILIKRTGLLYQLFGEIEKIVPFHMVEIPVLIHPFQIIILFDRFEESESYLANHSYFRSVLNIVLALSARLFSDYSLLPDIVFLFQTRNNLIL